MFSCVIWNTFQTGLPGMYGDSIHVILITFQTGLSGLYGVSVPGPVEDQASEPDHVSVWTDQIVVDQTESLRHATLEYVQVSLSLYGILCYLNNIPLKNSSNSNIVIGLS